ncbi:MAG TPA: glycosyltransferase family 9 protein [Candidatus Baltobacteraceae bacterium]|jgi:ADP-heptose:LPS heptosyltransferase|nr:glycosyltransferase family 9 protein [Candidatus Baltobacteraceae bacterium]
MKIAWLCLQGLGDALMATPAIAALRRAQPSAEIHVVTLGAAPDTLFGALPLVDTVHALPFWEKNVPAIISGLIRLRSLRFDASILAYPSVRREYHFVARAIGARTRISHAYEPFSKTFCFLETERIPIENEHNVLNNARLLAPLGVEIDASTLGGYAAPPSWQSTQGRTNEIAFHVGTMTYKGNENKRWPLERFIQTAQLLEKSGHPIAFICGPLEREVTERAIQSVRIARKIEGPIDHVAREISRMRVVITADNGIAHVSAAVRTPVITLFGLTDPGKCGPWGEDVHIVRPSDCPPCFDFGDATFHCKRQIDFRCLQKDLQVEHVLSALKLVDVVV